MDSSLLLIQLLNGLQLGILLFLLSAGLTLTFGIMDFVNLAHGSLYMLGAFICASLTKLTGSFALAALLALPLTALCGLLIELIVVRQLYSRDHLDHVLATFGLILCLDSLAEIVWGPAGIAVPLPEILNGQIEVLSGVVVPSFRLLIIAVGLLAAAGLYIVVNHTRLGMLIRAGASNRTMVGTLGVDIKTLFTGVFAMGAALAGLAIDTLGRSYLDDLFKLIMSNEAAETAAPAISAMLIYLLMAVILTVRPQGLFPAASR